MKIGIITFHRAHNYGAVLQCYALSTTLKKMGYDVDVIDYYPNYFKSQYSLYPWKRDGLSLLTKFKLIIKNIPILRLRKKRYIKFIEFINNLPLSSIKYISDKINISDRYDAIIWGSDQVWNPLLTNGVDNVFSGAIEKGNCIFISYAVSTNPQILSDKYLSYFRSIIEQYDYISTREQSLCSYLNAIRSKSAHVVLDPVLILDNKSWHKMAVLPNIAHEYLLIYTVPKSDYIYDVAKKIAKERNLEIIEIKPSVSTYKSGNILQSLSPYEFVGYFLGASYVVTNSFHGTAFAVKFNKQFITLGKGNGVDDRAESLLQILGIKGHLINEQAFILPPNDIDYNCVNDTLCTAIKDSLNFIQKSLLNEAQDNSAAIPDTCFV